MVQFLIEVINVSAPKSVKTATGGYEQIEVAYKRDGKVEGKKLVNFDTKDNPNNAAVYNFCKVLKGGESVNVTSEKGEKFWNWTAVSFSNSDGATDESPTTNQGSESKSSDAPTKQRATTDAPAGRGRVAGSNYETPTERAQRQIYIARQSSLERALDLIIANKAKNVDIAPEAVIEVAKVFEAYVMSPKSDFSDMKDDIPF